MDRSEETAQKASEFMLENPDTRIEDIRKKFFISVHTVLRIKKEIEISKSNKWFRRPISKVKKWEIQS